MKNENFIPTELFDNVIVKLPWTRYTDTPLPQKRFCNYTQYTSLRMTERSKTILRFAENEVERFGHKQVDTPHILTAIAKEGSGIGAQILREFNCTIRELRIETEALQLPSVELQQRDTTPSQHTITTLQNAEAETKKLGHKYIGTEHLLLGLLSFDSCLALQMLEHRSIKQEDVRERVMYWLGKKPEKMLTSFGGYTINLSSKALAKLEAVANATERKGEDVIASLVKTLLKTNDDEVVVTSLQE